jgi:hypothetical protein
MGRLFVGRQLARTGTFLYLCHQQPQADLLGPPGIAQTASAMRSVVFLVVVATAAGFGGQLPAAAPRLRRAPAISSLKARDCVFDQEPCESSGECRVNNAFCDDNHGFYAPGPKEACARKIAAQTKKKGVLPEVQKIFEDVAADQRTK